MNEKIWVGTDYIMERTGWGRTKLWEKRKSDYLPEAVRKDGRKSMWRKTTIDKWIAAGKHLD